MGDREKPVEGITTVPSSTSAFSLADLAAQRRSPAGLHDPTVTTTCSTLSSYHDHHHQHAPPHSALDQQQKSLIWSKAEKRLLLEEERWLLHIGLDDHDMRDELYAMCMKQVSKNPVL